MITHCGYPLLHSPLHYHLHFHDAEVSDHPDALFHEYTRDIFVGNYKPLARLGSIF
jgi:hypothetical protein